MKFRFLLFFFTLTAFAQHSSDRKIYATDITNKSGASVFYFPASLPLADRACVMNSNRQITSSTVTSTELGYLSGVTSALQTQLNSKASSAHTHSISDVTNLQTELDGKEPTISAGNTAQYWRGDKSWQTLDKTAVGLSNVDNTSDATKNAAAVELTNKTINITTNSGNALVPLQTGNSGKYLTTDGTTASWATVSATPSLTSNYIGYGDGSNLLTGSANLTWNNTDFVQKIDTPAASSSTPNGQLQLCRSTQTGCTSSDGMQIGFVDASSSTFRLKYMESGSFLIARDTTSVFLSSSSATRLIAPSGSTGIVNATSAGIAIGSTGTPSARLHVTVAGSTTAGTAPIKVTSGTVNTTPEAGTIEYDGQFYLTPSTTERFKLLQVTGASQPTCDASIRGQHWTIQGGAGVADTFQVCLKDSSDNYVWVTK